MVSAPTTRPAPARPPGLRARKKERTRRALEDAAVALFLERGFEHTTVEEIAAACDVSPRTFFRYFPTKEHVLVADDDAHFAQMLAALAARPAAEPPLRSLRAVVDGFIDGIADERERVLARAQIVAATPALQRHGHETHFAKFDALVDVLVRRDAAAGRPPRPLDIRVAVGVATAAFRAAVDTWIAEGAAGDLFAMVSLAFDRLDAVVGEDADRGDVGLVATDCFISADVEADGPIPGPFSMLSFGLVVAGTFDGSTFTAADLDAPETFYRELRPISDEVDPEALAVSGLDRDRLLVDGSDPAVAMTEARAWVRAVAGDRRPVLVAYPLSYDWMWLAWYFVRFADGGSPFGYSQCLDIKTMLATVLGVTTDRANKRSLPAGLVPDRPHTHHAIDDAVEQAELFARVFARALEWRG